MLASGPRITEYLPNWLRLLRPHHWTKNLLLFAPALTSSLILEHDILAAALLGFVSFCCAASTGYVLNDLADRDNDQDHPQKRYRPIASGDITATTSGAIGLACLALAAATGLALNTKFSLLLLLYLLLTTLYSLFIKHLIYLDLIALVGLYLIRIAAGAAAVGVLVSTWLGWYASALFLSLACMKRCGELTALQKINAERVMGRAYANRHLPRLLTIGMGAGLASVIVFGFYIADPATTELYGSSGKLWGVFMVFGCWITGLWISTYTGRMTYDPIVFVFSNFWSLLSLLTMLLLTLWAQVSASL